MYRAFFLLCRKVWKMKFRKVPSAVRLILQLPTAHAGRWNFPKCHLPNLATERKKYSVNVTLVFSCQREVWTNVMCHPVHENAAFDVITM